MRVKPGVILDGIKAEMLHAMALVDLTYLEVTGREATITSGLDSHVTGLHPMGYGVDFRVKDVPNHFWQVLRNRIDRVLNPYSSIRLYDVILETHKPGSEHIHIEFDPKILKKEGS